MIVIVEADTPVHFIHSIRTFSIIQFSRTIFEEEVLLALSITNIEKKVSISWEKCETAEDIINKDFINICCGIRK